MAKKIETLIEDINDTLQAVIDGEEVEIDMKAIDVMVANIKESLIRQLTPRTEPRKPKALYFSEAGKPCLRHVWYGVHGYDREPLLPSNLVKFIYGDILEELLGFLVKQAGHEVSDSQKSCVIELPNGWQLRGRLDYKIDGVVVDAKSASTYAFKKFTEGTLPTNDPFGYMTQLANYAIHEGQGEGVGFLVIEKQNGTIALYQPDAMDLVAAIPDWDDYINTIEAPHEPDREFDDKPFGKSGNRCLAMECSYCQYKQTCWSDSNGGKGLRLFFYSGKPVYMTDVKREPKVAEHIEDE